MPKKNLKLITVYTDGSCSGNGNLNAVGGIGIHFPNEELKDISRVCQFESCTNQKAELYAILTALRYIKHYLGLENYHVLIKTDSDYSINCTTKWVNGWIKNGWVTKNGKPVQNREFIEPIYAYYKKYNIEFCHVQAHTGLDDEDSIANACADELATNATKIALAKRSKNTHSKRISNVPNRNKFDLVDRTDRTHNTPGTRRTHRNDLRDKSRYPESETEDSESDFEPEPIHNHTKSQTNIKKGIFEVELIKSK